MQPVETMKYDVATDACRICLTKSKKLRSLYKPVEDDDEPPSEMLQKITGIEVEEMEEHTMLPKNICKNCELSLSMAFEFREKALQSQEVIVSYMRELKIPFETETEAVCTSPSSTLKDHIVDLTDENRRDDNTTEEILTDHEEEILNTATSPHSYSSTIDLPVYEVIIPVKGDHQLTDEIPEMEDYNEENLEDVIYEDSSDDITSVTDLHPQSNDTQSEPHEAEDIIEQEEDNEMNNEMHKELAKSVEDNNSTKAWDLTQDVAKIEINRDCSLESDIKAIPRRGKKGQRSLNNISYICDICGNVYSKRGRMMEHRQRHEKELKYACELCDKKFHMRELLRKHMYSHSGGKPLKCEYCSRTFYYESVRKAHEAIHQGLKPYVCDVCGKAFGYDHSLKKHKLIHAELKLYRCDYCNKDFRLQHHMKQHELTKSHQKAVYLAGDQVDISSCCMSVDNGHEIDDVTLKDEGIANIG